MSSSLVAFACFLMTTVFLDMLTSAPSCETILSDVGKLPRPLLGEY